jgi:hypothetical protein
MELWVARHWPRLVELAIASRLRSTESDRTPPSFLRYPVTDPSAARPPVGGGGGD